MIENTNKDVPRPWRWWFERNGAVVSGFASTKRGARQAMYAVMGVMPKDSEAHRAYRASLGLDES